MRMIRYFNRAPGRTSTRCPDCKLIVSVAPGGVCPHCRFPFPPEAPRNVLWFPFGGVSRLGESGDPCPEIGDERVICGFLWLPRFINGERRWLCVASIRQEFIEQDLLCRWVDVAWEPGRINSLEKAHKALTEIVSEVESDQAALTQTKEGEAA